jgi:hypothetical protein
MKPNTLRKVLSTSTIVAAGIALGASAAQAFPVTAVYTEDPRCDAIPQQTLSHELGEAGFFPINESLQISVSPATFTVCVPNDNVQNDWIVQIINVSGQAWTNLFFNGNLGTTVGNADGVILDVINAPGVITDAFRIDGTVTPGVNNNLLNESGAVDEILSPGESWRFNVSNFVGPGAGSPPPFFRTPGLFAGSAPLNAALPDSASILAIPVPEPSVITVIGAIGGALLLRRPRRA